MHVFASFFQSVELLQFAQITSLSPDLPAGSQVIILAGLKVVKNVCAFLFCLFFFNSWGGKRKAEVRIDRIQMGSF